MKLCSRERTVGVTVDRKNGESYRGRSPSPPIHKRKAPHGFKAWYVWGGRTEERRSICLSRKTFSDGVAGLRDAVWLEAHPRTRFPEIRDDAKHQPIPRRIGAEGATSSFTSAAVRQAVPHC